MGSQGVLQPALAGQRLSIGDYPEVVSRFVGSGNPRATLPPTVVQHPKTIANHDPAIESSFPSGKTGICMQSPGMVLHKYREQGLAASKIGEG